jgi:hypothetical protein
MEPANPARQLRIDGMPARLIGKRPGGSPVAERGSEANLSYARFRIATMLSSPAASASSKSATICGASATSARFRDWL